MVPIRMVSSAYSQDEVMADAAPPWGRLPSVIEPEHHHIGVHPGSKERKHRGCRRASLSCVVQKRLDLLGGEGYTEHIKHS